MVNRVLIGSYGGAPRLRVSRPGYDVTAALSDERLCFDSAWSEILTVYRASWADTSLPSGADAVAFGGYTWTVRYSTLAYGEVLPVKPIVLAWSRVTGVYITWLDASGNVAHTTQAALTLYPAMTASYEDRALIGRIGADPNAGVAYMVLHQRLDGYDTREAAGSTYRVLLGTHPARGGGLFVSRAGADVRYASDADLALSSRKLPLQAAEAGAYSPTARMTLASNATYPGGAWSWINYIDLAGSYPTFPPIIISVSNLGAMEPLPSKAAIKIHWINASRICIEVAGNWVPGAIPTGATIQWLIPKYDPSYVASASSPSTFRVQLSASGLRVSKPGIDVRYAADADLILDTSRSMLHIATRGTINNPGSLASGTTGIASAASAMPLVLFASYTFGRWWSFPNFIAVEAERTSGTTKYIGTQSWARIGSDGVKWWFAAGSQTSSIVYSIVNFSYYG